jgi:hypothetical protein
MTAMSPTGPRSMMTPMSRGELVLRDLPQPAPAMVGTHKIIK